MVEGRIVPDGRGVKEAGKSDALERAREINLLDFLLGNRANDKTTSKSEHKIP